MSILSTLKNVLSPIASIFTPQAVMLDSDFLAATPKQLLKQAVTSHLTYFGLAFAAMNIIYKFYPKLYLKIHRYNECRCILDFGTPWPMMRYCTEVAIEYGMCVVGYNKIPWMKETFPSPLHSLVAWRSIWNSFAMSLFPFHPDHVLQRSYVMNLVATAPGSVIAGSILPSGNECGTTLRSLYQAVTGTGMKPPARAILTEVAQNVTRCVCALATGALCAKVNGAGKRIGVVTFMFCIDVFAFRVFLIPALADKLTPLTVNGKSFTLNIPEDGQPVPFHDAEEEQEARTILMKLSAEQMQAVTQYCAEVMVADHVRGSVKTEAARLIRYASLLKEGTTNDGVELEEIGRVASVYEGEQDELDTHGVDAEHRTCMFCLEDFQETDQLATVRKCKHTFHLKCVQQWWGQHNNCPVCNTNLMREQSSDGGEGFAAGAGGGGARRGGDDDPEGNVNPENNPAEDGVAAVYQRLFRGNLRCRAPVPEVEWGPLKTLFYVYGNSAGMNAVTDLQAFDPEQQMQTSNFDLWHVVLVNLMFSIPNWE